MSKILVLGDYEGARWHPFSGIDKCISETLGGDVHCTSDYANLTADELSAYDLVVSYIDSWDSNGTRKTAGAIISYVASGGAFLSVHNGIIYRKTPELESMVGARFKSHPVACDLTYSPVGDHPILRGVETFTVVEEPYTFILDPLADREVFLTYSYEGEVYPAAWTLQFGMGKVAYLSPGHFTDTFGNEMFKKLMKNSALWCVGEL